MHFITGSTSSYLERWRSERLPWQQANFYSLTNKQTREIDAIRDDEDDDEEKKVK